MRRVIAPWAVPAPAAGAGAAGAASPVPDGVSAAGATLRIPHGAGDAAAGYVHGKIPSNARAQMPAAVVLSPRPPSAGAVPVVVPVPAPGRVAAAAAPTGRAGGDGGARLGDARGGDVDRSQERLRPERYAAGRAAESTAKQHPLRTTRR